MRRPERGSKTLRCWLAAVGCGVLEWLLGGGSRYVCRQNLEARDDTRRPHCRDWIEAKGSRTEFVNEVPKALPGHYIY